MSERERGERRKKQVRKREIKKGSKILREID